MTRSSKKKPHLSPREVLLVNKLVADGLKIQHKFRAQPLYKQTGKSHYEGSTVEDIQKARKFRQ